MPKYTRVRRPVRCGLIVGFRYPRNTCAPQPLCPGTRRTVMSTIGTEPQNEPAGDSGDKKNGNEATSREK